MVVKINARSNLTLIIGGQDFSKEFVQVQAAYQSLSLPGSGLCVMTGTLELTQTEDTNIDFDTRFNSLWARGAEITMEQDGALLPICGTCYIISADYDMASSLTINFGCALALYNFRTTEDLGVCLNFGTLEPVGNVLFSLVAASGIPAGNINLGPFLELNNYFITEPLLVGSTQSVLQAAGKIASQYGRFLVQRNTKFITIENVTEDDEYLHYHTAEEVQSYQRTGQPETIVSEIIFDYNKTSVLTELGSTAKSVRSGDTTVEVQQTRDTTNYTTSSTITELREVQPGNFATVAITTVTSKFEPESVDSTSVVRSGQVIDLDECFPDSESRILEKITTSSSDNTEVLKAWLATKAAAIEPSTFNVSGVITSEQKIEKYIYTDSSITKTTDVYQPIGLAIPLIADRALGRPSDPNFITDTSPTDFIVSDRIIENWSKSTGLSAKWSYTKNTFRNRYLVKPEDLTQQVLDASKSLQTIFVGSQELVPIARELQFNVSEPAVESFQIDTEIVSEPGSFVIGIPTGNEFEIKQRISLGDYNNVDLDLLKTYGSRIMDFNNGRIYGMQVAFSLYDIIKSDWTRILPFKKGKVREPSALRQNVASVFYIDSPTIVLSQTEGTISYVGAFIGFSNDSNNTSFFNDTIQPPPTLPSSKPITVLTFDDVDFNSAATFTFIYAP